jgi:hypothetical protein
MVPAVTITFSLKNNIFKIDHGFEGYYTNLHGDSAKLSYNLTGVGCKKVDVKSQPGS